MLHFGDFEDAISDMTHFGSDKSIRPVVMTQCCAAGVQLRNSHRFYLPSSAEILSGVPIVGSYREAASKLPYSLISINCGLNKSGQYRRIVIAISPDNRDEIIVSSLVKYGNSPWAPFPVAATITFPEGEDGYSMDVRVRPDFSSIEKPADLVAEDVLSVLNLCVMLSLHNVKAQQVSVPNRLAKKRKSHGKKPLYSYHVLNVDGEIWDSPRNEHSGSTVRSHLRRGHIRRLDDARRVWVRPTYVHGGTHGFVDKDYNVQVSP